MRAKTPFLTLSAALAATLVLSACGGDSSDGSKSSGASGGGVGVSKRRLVPGCRVTVMMLALWALWALWAPGSLVRSASRWCRRGRSRAATSPVRHG